MQDQQTREKWLSQYQDALITDLYLRENAKSRPSFALDQLPYKQEIRALEPEFRQLGTQIHVEVLRSGSVLRFDYRRRDALTRNAVAEQIGVLQTETARMQAEPVQQAQEEA